MHKIQILKYRLYLLIYLLLKDKSNLVQINNSTSHQINNEQQKISHKKHYSVSSSINQKKQSQLSIQQTITPQHSLSLLPITINELQQKTMNVYLKQFMDIGSFQSIQKGKQLLELIKQSPGSSKCTSIINKCYKLFKSNIPDAVLCSFQFFRELIQIGYWKVTLMIEQMLLMSIVEIIEYRSYVNQIQRGNSYFLSQFYRYVGDDKVNHLIKIGSTFFRMVHQVLFIWGTYYFPQSNFNKMLMKLIKSSNIKFPRFPQQFKFYSQTRIQLVKSVLQRNRKLQEQQINQYKDKQNKIINSKHNQNTNQQKQKYKRKQIKQDQNKNQLIINNILFKTECQNSLLIKKDLKVQIKKQQYVNKNILNNQQLKKQLNINNKQKLDDSRATIKLEDSRTSIQQYKKMKPSKLKNKKLSTFSLNNTSQKSIQINTHNNQRMTNRFLNKQNDIIQTQDALNMINQLQHIQIFKPNNDNKLKQQIKQIQIQKIEYNDKNRNKDKYNEKIQRIKQGNAQQQIKVQQITQYNQQIKYKQQDQKRQLFPNNNCITNNKQKTKQLKQSLKINLNKIKNQRSHSQSHINKQSHSNNYQPHINKQSHSNHYSSHINKLQTFRPIINHKQLYQQQSQPNQYSNSQPQNTLQQINSQRQRYISPITSQSAERYHQSNLYIQPNHYPNQSYSNSNKQPNSNSIPNSIQYNLNSNAIKQFFKKQLESMKISIIDGVKSDILLTIKQHAMLSNKKDIRMKNRQANRYDQNKDRQVLKQQNIVSGRFGISDSEQNMNSQYKQKNMDPTKQAFEFIKRKYKSGKKLRTSSKLKKFNILNDLSIQKQQKLNQQVLNQQKQKQQRLKQQVLNQQKNEQQKFIQIKQNIIDHNDINFIKQKQLENYIQLDVNRQQYRYRKLQQQINSLKQKLNFITSYNKKSTQFNKSNNQQFSIRRQNNFFPQTSQKMHQNSFFKTPYTTNKNNKFNQQNQHIMSLKSSHNIDQLKQSLNRTRKKSRSKLSQRRSSLDTIIIQKAALKPQQYTHLLQQVFGSPNTVLFNAAINSVKKKRKTIMFC